MNDESNPNLAPIHRSSFLIHRFLLSSWSSLECSPPCHGGDRGFKSHRGRLSRRSLARLRLDETTCVGWAWACPGGCKPPAYRAVQVRLLFDALNAAWPSGGTGRHATLRTSCPHAAWEFD